MHMQHPDKPYNCCLQVQAWAYSKSRLSARSQEKRSWVSRSWSPSTRCNAWTIWQDFQAEDEIWICSYCDSLSLQERESLPPIPCLFCSPKLPLTEYKTIIFVSANLMRLICRSFCLRKVQWPLCDVQVAGSINLSIVLHDRYTDPREQDTGGRSMWSIQASWNGISLQEMISFSSECKSSGQETWLFSSKWW